MGYFYQAGKRWRLQVFKNGMKKDIDLGKDRNKAMHLRRSIENAMVDEKCAKNLVEDLKELGILAEGTTAGAPAQEVSWKDAVERVLAHMEEIGRRPKTVSDAARSLRKLEEAFRPEKPADVGPEQADKWIGMLSKTPVCRDKTGVKKMSPAGVHSMIRSASTCFSRWVRWRWLKQNPFLACDKPRVPMTVPKAFEPQDFEKLLAASNAPLARSLKILTFSGMRPDELMHLRWKNVSLGNAPGIYIRQDEDWHPKAHTERFIPASKALIAALGKPGDPGRLVAGFNDRGYAINMSWFQRTFRRAIKRASLKDRGYTIYTCRDTYATNLAIQGLEAHAIAARLGHRNLQTSMRYVSMSRLVRDSHTMDDKMMVR